MLMCPCNGVIIHLSTELYLLTTCTYYMLGLGLGFVLALLACNYAYFLLL